MKIVMKIIYLRTIGFIVLAWLVLTGCLFSTREPEMPDTRRSSFQPPTSAQVVVANLQNSIREKNAENYAQCLIGSDGSTARIYVFEPSAEAASRFAGVFVGWNVSRERQAFIAMTARIPASHTPSVSFFNDRFEVQLPDSAVYVADYFLRPNYNFTGAPSVFSGKLRLTISVLSTGLWAISRWSDQLDAQATTASWSILKAQFAN
jgi:hypothetical protein